MNLLLIEDDKELSAGIVLHLEKEGFHIDCCYSGNEGLTWALNPEYSLIILDCMLPVLDGISILKALRKAKISTPILLLTALSGVRNRVDGLDAGADDYLTKPFAMEELLARIRALLRRPPIIESKLLCYSELNLIPDSRILTVNGHSVSLSKREYELLAYLIKKHDTVLSRELLLTHVWGLSTEVENGTLDTYIHFLRRRLRLLNANVVITTIFGTGYRLEARKDSNESKK